MRQEGGGEHRGPSPSPLSRPYVPAPASFSPPFQPPHLLLHHLPSPIPSSLCFPVIRLTFQLASPTPAPNFIPLWHPGLSPFPFRSLTSRYVPSFLSLLSASAQPHESLPSSEPPISILVALQGKSFILAACPGLSCPLTPSFHLFCSQPIQSLLSPLALVRRTLTLPFCTSSFGYVTLHSSTSSLGPCSH